MTMGQVFLMLNGKLCLFESTAELRGDTGDKFGDKEEGGKASDHSFH
jgi:hypothetical protein